MARRPLPRALRAAPARAADPTARAGARTSSGLQNRPADRRGERGRRRLSAGARRRAPRVVAARRADADGHGRGLGSPPAVTIAAFFAFTTRKQWIEEVSAAASKPPKPRRDFPATPSASFRRRAWRQFQRALDPLGPPKPLRPPRGSGA